MFRGTNIMACYIANTVCVGVALLVFVMAADAGRVPGASAPLALTEGEKPWFCHDLDCPAYTSKKNITVEGVLAPIELRAYPAAKWATTRVLDVDNYDKAVATGFWRLYKYISGENTAETKIEMTAPVIVRVDVGAGPECDSGFTISFYVPVEHQAAPPEPTSELVAITELPAMKVYVRSFGGWAVGKRYVAEASSVTQALSDAGYAVDDSYYFTAGYDSPFRLLNRHNEVWIPAASAPAPEPPSP